MPHRVLLDFTCPESAIEARPADSPAGRDGQLGQLPPAIRHALVQNGRWATAEKAEQQSIINHMAAQLPDHDIASYVKNVQHAMQRKAPYADLTLGWFTNEGVGKVRVRIASHSEAILAALARETATLLLQRFPELELTQMTMFQARADDALIHGEERETEGYSFWNRDNLPVAVPLVVSLLVIIVGGILSLSFWGRPQPVLLGDSLTIWYGRLFGPMLMASITLGSTVVRDMRRQIPIRTAEWVI